MPLAPLFHCCPRCFKCCRRTLWPPYFSLKSWSQSPARKRAHDSQAYAKFSSRFGSSPIFHCRATGAKFMALRAQTLGFARLCFGWNSSFPSFFSLLFKAYELCFHGFGRVRALLQMLLNCDGLLAPRGHLARYTLPALHTSPCLHGCRAQ